MATAAQYAAKQVRSPIVIIGGTDEALRQYCVDLFIRTCPPAPLLHKAAGETPLATLMEELLMSTPFDDHRIFLVTDIHRWKDMTLMERYAKNVRDDTTVILLVDKLKKRDGSRWLPNEKNILYIDCNGLTEKTILKFVQATANCTELNAQKIITKAGGEVSELIRLIKLCSLFPADPPVDQLCPSGLAESPLTRYGVTRADGLGIWNQLHINLGRIMQIALALRAGATSPVTIASQLNTEPFIVTQWTELARERTPEDWMDKLHFVARSEKFYFMPHYKEYMEKGMA